MDSKIINTITPGDLHKINKYIESIEVSLRSEYSDQELLDLTHMIREQIFKEIESLDSSKMKVDIDLIIYQNQYVNHQLFKDAGKNEVLYSFTFQRGLKSIMRSLKAPFTNSDNADEGRTLENNEVDLSRERSKVKTFIWSAMFIYVLIGLFDHDENSFFSPIVLLLVVFINIFYIKKVTKIWLISNFILLEISAVLNAIIGVFGEPFFFPELLMILGSFIYPSLLFSIVFRLAKENYAFNNFNHKPLINRFGYFVVVIYSFSLILLILTSISFVLIMELDEYLYAIIFVFLVFDFLVYLSGGFNISPKTGPANIEQPHGMTLSGEVSETQVLQQTPTMTDQQTQSSKGTRRAGIVEFTPDFKKLRRLTKFGRFRWTKRFLVLLLLTDAAIFVIFETSIGFYDYYDIFEISLIAGFTILVMISFVIILDAIDWSQGKRIRIVVKHLLLRQGVMDHDYFYKPPADMTSDEYTQIIGQLILDKYVQVKFLREDVTK